MKLVQDFFNKFASEIRSSYFPSEDHGRTENKKYHETNYAIECFSNGCLSYKKLIQKLAKSCGDTELNIHNIAKKYVEDFEGYSFL